MVDVAVMEAGILIEGTTGLIVSPMSSNSDTESVSVTAGTDALMVEKRTT